MEWFTVVTDGRLFYSYDDAVLALVMYLGAEDSSVIIMYRGRGGRK